LPHLLFRLSALNTTLPEKRAQLLRHESLWVQGENASLAALLVLALVLEMHDI
jgi:hypothetical protein